MIKFDIIAIIGLSLILFILVKDYVQFLKKAGVYKKGKLLEHSWLIENLKYQKPIILMFLVFMLFRVIEDLTKLL